MVRLFNDKPRDYTEPSRSAESIYAFLDRSSLPEYERMRYMLQHWVDRFPSEHQRKIVGPMRHKGSGSRENDKAFYAAFFELFLHEFLWSTDGVVEAQPPIARRPPDFRVTTNLQDGTPLTYTVEATDINLESGTALERDQQELSVWDTLNEIYSPDFFLIIETQGKLESLPTKWQLKRHFEELIKETDYDDQLRTYMLCDQNLDLLPTTSFQHGDWTLIGRLIPVLPENRPRSGKLIWRYPSRVSYIDDIGKTKARLYDKANQHKIAENLIIALRCDRTNNRLDEALLGRLGPGPSLHHVLTSAETFRSVFYNRRNDGFWANNSGPQNRHVIGVVVFSDLYPWTITSTKAEFYSNPYTDKPLPGWAKSITHAEYSNGEVNTVEGIPPYRFLGDYEAIKNPFA